MPPRAVFNFVYVLMVENLDPKEREDFDASLNSGISTGQWTRIESRAWERLERGEFDRGTDLGEQDIGDQ
jgi:hypothetical protein